MADETTFQPETMKRHKRKITVLITGASGYLGSHIIEQLLHAGNYNIKAIVRHNKVALVQDRYKKINANVEIYGIGDIVTADLSATLQGVDTVLHLATPVIGGATGEEMLYVASGGALNVLENAVKASVRRVVITSSVAALVHPDPARRPDHKVYTEQDWSDVTEKEAWENSSNPNFSYATCKALAERKIWDFADAHPEIDVTTILPPFLYGPLARGYEVTKDRVPRALSSNALIMQLLVGKSGRPLPKTDPGTMSFVDVRDAALAHVRAVSAPLECEVGRKRLLISGGRFTWPDAVEYLAQVRPQIADRLPDPNTGDRKLRDVTFDTTRTQELLGIDGFKDWRTTFADATDSILTMFASWAHNSQ